MWGVGRAGGGDCGRAGMRGGDKGRGESRGKGESREGGEGWVG